jgi:hypothetical protein
MLGMQRINENDIADYAIDGKTVLTTLTNYGYLLYTLNMLKSLRPFGLEKQVFIVCMDRKGAIILQNKGYRVLCLESTLGAFCPWNSKGYDKICYVKLELIYRILSLEKNVLLIDGDIVFQKSPLPDIVEWTANRRYTEVFIQNDSTDNRDMTNMCTGYVFIRSTPNMIHLYDCVSEEGLKKYERCALDNNDQSYFNTFVKPYCEMNALPLEYYPNGKMFYDYMERVKYTAILVHFNWIKGHLKMAKMKEYKMWLLDDDDEML